MNCYTCGKTGEVMPPHPEYGSWTGFEFILATYPDGLVPFSRLPLGHFRPASAPELYVCGACGARRDYNITAGVDLTYDEMKPNPHGDKPPGGDVFSNWDEIMAWVEERRWRAEARELRGPPADPQWEPVEDNTLDSLLLTAGWDQEQRDWLGTPWRKGDEAVYRGMGGMEVRGSRHEVVATGYASHLSGDRHLVVNNDVDITIKESQQIVQHDSGQGIDALTVRGNMTWDARLNRLVIGSGTIDRLWKSAILKITGMEGVICGGAWNRTFAGGLMTTSGMRMGDVFGGAVVGTGARVNVSRVMYRSSEYASWTMNAYTRNMVAVVEPLIGSAATAPTKVGRAKDIALKISFTILPLLGVLFLAALPIILLFAFVAALDRKYFAAPAAAGAGAPRVRTRTVAGNTVEVRQSEVIV